MNATTNEADLVAVVKQIVAKLADVPGDRRFHDLLGAIRALPGVSENRDLSFSRNEYVVRVGKPMWLEEEAHSLDAIRRWSLVSAPEIVELIHAYENDDVLVTRYRACPGEQLLNVRAMKINFSEPAQDQFRKDMQTLIDHGVMHPYAPRGFAHWLIGSRSGTLVLNGWSALRECTPSEGADALKRIGRLLADGNEYPTD